MINTKNGLVLGATALMVSTVAVFSIGTHSQGQALFKESPKELVDEVWQIVYRQYVDGTFNKVDWQSVRQEYLKKSYSSPEEAHKSIREMLEKLKDPYTRFMDPQEFKNMQVETSGELTGVGIQITQDEKTKQLVVVSPIEGTPASDAGIMSKDLIVKINGKSTKGMDTNQAVSLIRGKAGTAVTLTINRNGALRNFNIKRAKIEIHPVKFTQNQSSAGNIGYIRLNQFSANAAKEMQQAIKDLEGKKVAGYIMDLRSNPGGLLYSSTDIASMWMDKGTIVSTVTRSGPRKKEVASPGILTKKPLVILVDGGSASASEILSGALQDNKRATLVGTKTFGKGLVQSVRPLDGGAGLAVTIAKYLTPSGRDINKKGIEPDIEVKLSDTKRQELSKERNKIGTKADPQYAKALEVLTKKIVAQKQMGNTSAQK